MKEPTAREVGEWMAEDAIRHGDGVEFTEINSPDDFGNCSFKYISIEDYFRINGHRHLERAIAYASASYPEHYYQGSMKKALKNYKTADSFKLPELDPIFQDAMDAFLYGVSYALINGDGTSKKLGLQNILKEPTLWEKCCRVLRKLFKRL